VSAKPTIDSMTSNGRRKPPRPSIELVAPRATAEEAAAIAAALERFLHDTAPLPAAGPRPSMGVWERAALAEGVGLCAPAPWSDTPGWE
jgi:hypothetical protein